MDRLAEFLTACVDEDEAAAMAAARVPGKDWDAAPQGQGRERDGILWDQDRANVIAWFDGLLECAQHAARYDPRRALREVEAKRAILAEHVPHELTPHWSICEECSEFVTSPGSYQGDEEEGEEPPDDYRRDSWPCSTVRHLAAVYSDRPGYAEATRPAAASS